MSESLNLTTQAENSVKAPDTHSDDPSDIDQTVLQRVIDLPLSLIPSFSNKALLLSQLVLS